MTPLHRIPPGWSTLTAVALALSAPAVHPQPLGNTPPPGQVMVSTEELKTLKDDLKAARTRATAAETAASKAEARAQQAGQSRPAGVAPEQLEAARRERDTARQQRDAALGEVEDLKSQLTQAQAALKRGQSAAGDVPALRDERDRLKSALRAQQERADGLQSQLTARDKTITALRAMAPPPAASVAVQAALPAVPASTSSPATSLALPPAGIELTVPGCGAACPSFVIIPNPGRVTLGSGAEAITADFRHRFAMGRTEVTVGQWKVFWNAADRDYQPVKTDSTYCNWNDGDYAKDDRLPVRCVNTADAEAYARWFARRYGGQLGLRVESIGLPTELEWEFSARGGRYTEQYLWPDNAGKDEKCRHAQINDCPGTAVPVATRLKNGYGLHDVIGNVWEWTASEWRADRKSIPADGRDAAAGVSAARAVRGASFIYLGDGSLRLADRFTFTPGSRNNYFGFRLVARIAS